MRNRRFIAVGVLRATLVARSVETGHAAFWAGWPQRGAEVRVILRGEVCRVLLRRGDRAFGHDPEDDRSRYYRCEQGQCQH